MINDLLFAAVILSPFWLVGVIHKCFHYSWDRHYGGMYWDR